MVVPAAGSMYGIEAIGSMESVSVEGDESSESSSELDDDESSHKKETDDERITIDEYEEEFIGAISNAGCRLAMIDYRSSLPNSVEKHEKALHGAKIAKSENLEASFKLLSQASTLLQRMDEVVSFNSDASIHFDDRKRVDCCQKILDALNMEARKRTRAGTTSKPEMKVRPNDIGSLDSTLEESRRLFLDEESEFQEGEMVSAVRSDGARIIDNETRSMLAVAAIAHSIEK